MNPSQNGRGSVMRAMMRNPENSRLIREAFSSGLGSTSRKKAQRSFSIMAKLNNSYDGAGGPGMMANQMSYGQSQQETGPITISNEGSKGMVIFHKIPKSRIIYGKKVTPKATAFDGSGGPGNALDGLGRLGSLFATPFTNTQPPTWEQQRDALRAKGARQAAEKKAAEERAAMFPQTKINTGVFTPRPPLPPEPPTWQPGIIPRLGGWLANKALPAVGGAILTGGATLASGVDALRQFAQQNIAELPFAAWRGLVGKDTSLKDQPGPGWLPLSQTQGIQELARMFPGKPGASTTPVASGALPMTDAQRATLRAQGAAATQIGTTTPKTPTGGTDWSAIMGGPKTQETTATTTAPGVPSIVSRGLSDLGSAGKDAVTQSGFSSGAQAGATASNIAASNIASFLKTSVDTNPFTSIKMEDLMKAIATNEGFFSGASIASANNNNPGNLKYVGQAGATQGGQAADGGNFAKFATMNDGWEALKNDLEAKKNSGKYPTLEDLMNVYSPNSGAPSGGTPPGGQEGPGPALTGDAAVADDYRKRNIGAGQFVLDTMAKEGGSLNARAAANKASVMDEYGIDALRTGVKKLQKEKLDLPDNVTEYIKQRDQYIVQTDKAIADYVKEMSTMTMSDPSVAQEARDHLNTLYTLRGRQNQTYVGYINQTIKEHQRKLDDANDTYTDTLALAEASLASKNAITQDEYNMRAAALNDMYTSLKNAPMEVDQARILHAQAKQAEALAAMDAADKIKNMGLIEAAGKLKSFVWDGKYVLPNVDLMKTIRDFPEISSQNIIDTYMLGVNNYMSASIEKDEVTGTGITAEKKNDTARMAIKQLAYLANANAPDPKTGVGGDPVAYNGAKAAAYDVADYLAISQAKKIEDDGKALQLMEAVRGLAPKGIWGGAKTPPTLDQFIKNLTEKTGNPLDESIARAIYAVFQSIVNGSPAGKAEAIPADTPANAMNAFLYPSSSTENWTEEMPYNMNTPYTAKEFAKIIGELYAMNIVSQAFSLQ